MGEAKRRQAIDPNFGRAKEIWNIPIKDEMSITALSLKIATYLACDKDLEACESFFNQSLEITSNPNRLADLLNEIQQKAIQLNANKRLNERLLTAT